MISDVRLKEIIETVAVKNNVSVNVVDLIVDNCYSSLKNIIKESETNKEVRPKTIMLKGMGKYIPKYKFQVKWNY